MAGTFTDARKGRGHAGTQFDDESVTWSLLKP
jgi:hypothetical protein